MKIEDPDTLDGIDIRPVAPDELEPFFAAVSRVFAGPPATPEQIESAVENADGVHYLAAWDGGRIVGSSGWYPMSLTVPGRARIPVCGVTAVTVSPTHRRRGLLTRMLTRILRESADRGDPASVLLASEGVIYGRFGYGVGSLGAKLEVDVRRARFMQGSPPDGSLTLLEPDEFDEVAPAVFTAASGKRPGGLDRPAEIWARSRVSRKPGSGHAALYRSPDGTAEGYVAYEMQNQWEPAGPNYTLEVRELVAITDRATEALWRYCFGVDLVGTVSAFWRPPDDPLRWLLTDPRMVGTTQLGDVLWVRPLDPAALLEARTYGLDGALTIEVNDPVLGRGGTLQLDVSGGRARCAVSSGDPDLVMGVSELGSVYLGGISFVELAAARRIAEHSPGALGRADAMFAHRPLPWCQTAF